MDSLSRFLIFSEAFRPKRGVFPISTGVFRSHLPAVLAHAGRREQKGKECRGRVAFGSQGVRIIRCSFVDLGETRSSCKIISPLSDRPTTFFDGRRVAACCTRISEFCSSLIRFPVCISCVFFARPRQLYFVFCLHLFTRLR